jgi:hypothetical protein
MVIKWIKIENDRRAGGGLRGMWSLSDRNLGSPSASLREESTERSRWAPLERRRRSEPGVPPNNYDVFRTVVSTDNSSIHNILGTQEYFLTSFLNRNCLQKNNQNIPGLLLISRWILLSPTPFPLHINYHTFRSISGFFSREIRKIDYKLTWFLEV